MKKLDNLQKFYKYIIDNYSYKEHIGELQTPKELVNSKQGDCIEINNLMYDYITRNYLGKNLKLYLLFFQIGENVDMLDKGKSVKNVHSVLIGSSNDFTSHFWVEASFENLKGCYVYQNYTQNDVLKDIKIKYLNEYPNEDPNKLRIIKYERNNKLKKDVDFFNSLNFK